LQVEAYHDATGFAALREVWNPLVHASAVDTVFATWEWQKVWWDSFGASHELHLLAMREGLELVGLAPFMVEVVNGQRLLRLIGGTEVADYLDIITAPGREEEVWAEILHYFAGVAWDQLDLHAIAETSPTRPILDRLGQGGAYRVESLREDICPRFDLPASWAAYLESLSSKNRHELRRKLRRLAAEASYNWHTVHDPAEIPAAVATFAELHRQSSRDKRVFMDQAMEAYFLANAQAMLQAGWLWLSFLEVNGRRVAGTYAYDYNGTVALYNSGYDPTYSYLSVGLLAVVFCLQEAVLAGRCCFDFLQGSEPYKYDLGGKDLAVYNIKVNRLPDSPIS
jgi:CelD/BcsL family acetyltransferase involved in cellulose biosynthesis